MGKSWPASDHRADELPGRWVTGSMSHQDDGVLGPMSGRADGSPSIWVAQTMGRRADFFSDFSEINMKV